MHECKGGLKRACARIGDRVDVHVCGFWVSNKAKPTAFTFHTGMISTLTKCFTACNYMFSFIFRIHCSIKPLG